MSFIAELSLILIAAAVLCCYVGWGAARLALPPSLASFRAPLTPLIGYVVLLWSGFMLASLVLNLRWTVAVILIGATVLNILTWRAEGPPQPLAWLRAQPEALIPPLLALLTGILPLLEYGYPTIIGRGWDTEAYLPMAQHLIDYSLPRIPEAPQSLLRDLVTHPPRIGLTLGFSIFHGMTMIFSGASALASFAPVIAFMRALAVLAMYVWLRATMDAGRVGSFLGATLTALTSLMLWIGYFNFGMQMSAWCLLALALTTGLAAVDDLAQRRLAAWRGALLAAIALAAIPIAYYPALVIAVPLISAAGAARLFETWRHPQPYTTPISLALAALALAGLTLAASALAVQDYFEGFSFRYSLIEPKIGPDRFIGVDEILGLTAFRLSNDGDQPPSLLIGVALLATVLPGCAALVLPHRWRNDADAGERTRLRWTLTIAAVAAALIWLRFGRPYEYGFMKGAAYTSFVIWGLTASGVERIAQWTKRTGMLLASSAALLILACTGWSQSLTVADHIRGPAIFTRDIAAFDRVAAQLPHGATVLLSGDETLTGPINGMLATMLYGKELWGRVPAAYAAQSFWSPGETPNYVVLAAREDPWPLDVGAKERWRSSAIALYEMPPDATFVLGRSESYVIAAVDPKSPASLAIWRRAGHNRVIAPNEPFTLEMPHAATLRLTLAALEAQTVMLRQGHTTTTLSLEAGVTTIKTGSSSTVQVIPTAPLALVHAVVSPTDTPTPVSTSLDITRVAWSATSEQQGDQIVLSTSLANPGNHALRYEVIIIGDTFDAPVRIARLLAAAPLEGEWRLALDLARGASEARMNGAPAPMLAADVAVNPPDGRYFGVLAIYSGGAVVAQAPLFTMTMSEGAVATFEPVFFSVETARARSDASPLPAHQRALLAGTPLMCDELRLALEQIVLERQSPPPGVTPVTPLSPGERLNVQVFWRATGDRENQDRSPMVSFQVLDDENRKWAQWDGVLGDWLPVPAWKPGAAVRQDIPLTLDAATPPGDYRLLLIVYDPSTGRPILVAGQEAAVVGKVRVAASGGIDP
ncbi:hypothetical protein [Roseiflexus castenholzii]|uniref:Glycosyltransferase RgtA/B/C/D-like domain-containing protein n=1 Tax=Roseiflexus castenholzii (strain DSM 13941 / HLO8) TaxID=383372 RepID=A7NSC9_ROSCS|nr:hypothetical protein [Roseiflexus castenholzii]ABU58558.1 hypothetical protein Rcas_2478 [Roseiflexus castenholzii DSM 13941]